MNRPPEAKLALIYVGVVAYLAVVYLGVQALLLARTSW